jgi:hypothetical protein
VTLAITGNGTYSFALSGGSTNIAGYNSREATTNRPQLVIEQTAGAAPASASAAAEEEPIEEDPAVHGLALPREIALRQNYPNPFMSYTHLRFELPRASQVRLRIYDVMGRVVKTLVDQQTAPGVHEISWDGRDRNGLPLSSGVYLLRMETPEMSLTRRVLLAR